MFAPETHAASITRHRASFSLVVLVLFALGALGCGSPALDGADMDDFDLAEPACSCSEGDRRCVGTSLQVCESSSPTCASWGPQVSCSTGMCMAGSCGGSCQDACTAGALRCSADSQRQICRLSGSGCLDWVQEACPGAQFCVNDRCVDSIPCATPCPNGYSCQRNGVCAGGNPADVVLNVQTVQLSGRITRNGAAPENDTSVCSSTKNAAWSKGVVTLFDSRKGYRFEINIDACRASTFTYQKTIFPGTYRVTIRGNADNATGTALSNLPVLDYLVDPALVIAGDTPNKVLDVQTVQIAGRLTVNSATPMADTAVCSATENAELPKALITFYEPKSGYRFEIDSDPCKVGTFQFKDVLFPGIYRVTVRGMSDNATGTPLSNIPTVDYVAEQAYAVAADVPNKVLNIQTLRIAGNITLNGAALENDTSVCSATENADSPKAEIVFYEPTKGYRFEMYSDACRSGTFRYAETIYPGTYRITVRGLVDNNTGVPLSNLPTETYQTDQAFVVAADVPSKVLAVETLQFSGRITLNGAAPQNTNSVCNGTKNPDLAKARVTFYEPTRGYQFEIDTDLCKSAAFGVKARIFPGTYRVTVLGLVDNDSGNPLSNLPTISYVAEQAFVIAGDTASKLFDVKTVQLTGTLRVNGAAPENDTSVCSATKNATEAKARIVFFDASRGYNFEIYADPCRLATFNFKQTLFPGTYRVTVQGEADNNTGKPLSSIPTLTYLANPALVVAGNLDQVLDVQSVQVGGKITVQGMPAMSDATVCSATKNSTRNKASVFLYEATRGYQFELPSDPCRLASFSYKQTIFPGTYRVTVQGMTDNATGKPLTNIPTESYVAVDRLQLP